MAPKTKPTIRILWTAGEGEEHFIDVLAPIITLNTLMIDRQLRKAGLVGFGSLIRTDEVVEWIEYDVVANAFKAADAFFIEHPESIPFSDILGEIIPEVLKALGEIPKHAQLCCWQVEVE